MNQSTQSAQFLRTHWVFLGLLALALQLASCRNDDDPPALTDASAYPADVVTSWLNLQLRLTQAAPASQPVMARRFAYAGLALYESIVPGLTRYQSLAPQLSGLGTLPAPEPNARYHWPASANAAMAAMSRSLFPAASTPAGKAAVDSLEAANTARYRADQSAEDLVRSAEFGKKIATAIFDWSKTDGYDNATPFVPPVGVGMWVPTPPAFAPPALPNWGKLRPFATGSDAGTDQAPPVAYSEDPASAYYAQAKEVYEISQNLTAEQRTIAQFWPDHLWHGVLSQVLAKEKPDLDKAAVAFAQLGMAMSDAAVALFKSKYRHTGVRPVTYIRAVMKQPTWNTVIATPAHPEFPSGHSVMSAAAAETLTQLFGANYKYTDKPFNLPAFAPRSFDSFGEAAIEAGTSRVYAGIHYRKTCEVSLEQGKRIGRNVAQTLKFKR